MTMDKVVYDSLKNFAVQIDKLDRQGQRFYSQGEAPVRDDYPERIQKAVKPTREMEGRRE